MDIGIVTTVIVGILCIILGISNMRGNISSIHSYHRSRVTEENKLPFGRLVGLGTVIIGIGIIIFSVAMLLTHFLETSLFIFIGVALMILAFAVGIFVSFYAMKKYNGGIF